MSDSERAHRTILAQRLLPLMVLASLAVPAAPATPPEPEEIETRAPEAPAPAGLRVVLDPETGEILNEPSYAALERLADGTAAEERRSAWDLREFRLPSGGRGVFLDGWADHSLKVTVDAEGKITAECSVGDRHGSAETAEASEQ